MIATLKFKLPDEARELEADLLVTVCPMCQMNVDSYQGEMDRHLGLRYHMPILFFTQLMGLAFGSDARTLGVTDGARVTLRSEHGEMAANHQPHSSSA